MINLLEAALGYAAQGWPIFPLAPGTKIPPKGSSGFKDATTDPDTIREIWTRTPDANIGFEPGRVGLCAWDVEHDGLQDWADLWEDHLEIEPTTRVHSSPRGGRHVFFAGSLPGKVRIKTPSGRKLNIDTRGEGSYVLLPPSQVDGNSYKVVTNAQPAPLPAFLSELARSRTHAVEVPDDVELDRPPNLARAGRHVADCIRRGHVSIQGQGGDRTLYELACDISDFGVSQERCAELLSGDWSAACVPPWSVEPDYFGKVIANAYEYQRNRASGANASRATWSGFDPATFVPQGGGVPEDSRAISDPGRGSMGMDDGTGQRRSRFALLSEREQDELSEPRWLIPRLIPMAATVLHTAAAKTYKTFLALDISMAIASQRETFGVRPSLAGDVVYAALEGRVGIAKLRRKAWRKARGIPEDEDLPFLLTSAPHIVNAAECEEFYANLDAHVASGRTMAMIVIDTLAKSMTGMDENAAVDSGLMLAFIDGLRDRYGCAVYVVAHAGYTKEGKLRVRGSSTIPAGYETLILSERDEETDIIKVWVENHKDADTDDCEWHFQARRLGGSLVMDLMTKDEASERARKLDPYALDKIGAALAGLGASGRDKGVTTHVLAMALTAHLMDDDEEAYQEAVAKAEKALRQMAKMKAKAYCATRARELIWFMPE